MENLPNVNKETQPEFIPRIPELLPLNNMYSIQVGSKCFKISGASLSSDGPSYFTNYFSSPENSFELLYIDRSPKIFDKIVSHLQGYYIDVNDCIEMIQIYSDACYFNFPRLKSQLENMDIFARIGTKEFRIPRKLFKDPGNSPNFFTTSSDYIFKDVSNVINDLDLIRPPVQAPITLTDRSSDLFEVILNYLQGNEIAITSESLRRSLIKECRYYRFLRLEQKFVESNIFWDYFTMSPAILLKLEDIRPKQVGLCSISSECNIASNYSVSYQRPFLDNDVSRVLYFQTGSTSLYYDNYSQRIIFRADSCLKLTKAFGAIFQEFPREIKVSNTEVSIKFDFQIAKTFSDYYGSKPMPLSKRQIFGIFINGEVITLVSPSLQKFIIDDPAFALD